MSPDLAKSSRAALRSMEGNIDELPLLPQVLVKLLQLKRDADDYFDQFEVLVKEDPAFAVRVISIANSSSSAPVSPITNIRDAITRMGAATISGLVASLAVQKVFVPTTPGEVRLWTHSVLAAFATEQVAKLATELKVDAGQAYLAGLLHDIGRFVMLEHAGKELQAVDESHWRSPDELIAADVEVYKYTHSELGYLACKRWGLPIEVSSVVRDHHNEIMTAIEPGSIDAASYCVQVADRLCIFVLENTDDQDEQALRDKVENDCVIAVAGTRWLDAAALTDSISDIKEASESLLSGLGLSQAL